MLRRVEPYITWGYPNLKTVRELVYKRGYGKVNKNRIPLTDNSIIEQARGRVLPASSLLPSRFLPASVASHSPAASRSLRVSGCVSLPNLRGVASSAAWALGFRETLTQVTCRSHVRQRKISACHPPLMLLLLLPLLLLLLSRRSPLQQTHNPWAQPPTLLFTPCHRCVLQSLGKHNIICTEDLVHEIFTVGPNFRAATNFLWPFKLSAPKVHSLAAHHAASLPTASLSTASLSTASLSTAPCAAFLPRPQPLFVVPVTAEAAGLVHPRAAPVVFCTHPSPEALGLGNTAFISNPI